MKKIWFGVLAVALALSSPAFAEKNKAAGAARPARGTPHIGGGMPRMHAPPRVAHPMVRQRAPAFRARRSMSVRHRPSLAVHGRNFHHRPAAVYRHHRGRTVVVRRASPKFAKFHRVVRAPRRFHIGIYRRPHGWFSHRWRLGERLPRGWFARSYWIPNWSIYGLWAPYDGLVWVRVGPDAFLIDPASGEVVSIEYGVFW
jgi:Ni/Co efflux regulator RcnB